MSAGGGVEMLVWQSFYGQFFRDTFDRCQVRLQLFVIINPADDNSCHQFFFPLSIID